MGFSSSGCKLPHTHLCKLSLVRFTSFTHDVRIYVVKQKAPEMVNLQEQIVSTLLRVLYSDRVDSLNLKRFMESTPEML